MSRCVVAKFRSVQSAGVHVLLQEDWALLGVSFVCVFLLLMLLLVLLV